MSTGTTSRTSSGPVGDGGNAGGSGRRSVRTELQADCFAGVWADNAVCTGYIEPMTASNRGALDAAEAVGDDRIQEASSGRVTPRLWTHGTSDQRERWFTTGYRPAT